MLVDSNGNPVKTILTAVINCSTSGNNEIVAAVASKRIKVLAIVVNFAAAVSAKWRSANTDLGGAMPFDVREGYVVSSPNPVLQTVAGEALNLNLSGAVAATGWVAYHADDAT